MKVFTEAKMLSSFKYLNKCVFCFFFRVLNFFILKCYELTNQPLDHVVRLVYNVSEFLRQILFVWYPAYVDLVFNFYNLKS